MSANLTARLEKKINIKTLNQTVIWTEIDHNLPFIQRSTKIRCWTSIQSVASHGFFHSPIGFDVFHGSSSWIKTPFS
jgi:hypothetical protein